MHRLAAACLAAVAAPAHGQFLIPADQVQGSFASAAIETAAGPASAKDWKVGFGAASLLPVSTTLAAPAGAGVASAMSGGFIALTPGSITAAVGAVAVTPPGASNILGLSADAAYNIKFTITDPAPIVWGGLVAIESEGSLTAQYDVHLLDAEGGTLFHRGTSSGELAPFLFKTTLQPGQYELLMLATAGGAIGEGAGGSFASISFETTFLIPVPGATLALGAGALSAAIRRRRRPIA